MKISTKNYEIILVHLNYGTFNSFYLYRRFVRTQEMLLKICGDNFRNGEVSIQILTVATEQQIECMINVLYSLGDGIA